MPGGVGDGKQPSPRQLAQQPRSRARAARDDLTGEPECHFAVSADNADVPCVEGESGGKLLEGDEEGSPAAARGATC